MKVLCPKCNQTVVLGYLEEEGGQMGCCGKCKIYIKALYEDSDNRAIWNVGFEKPVIKKKKAEPKRGGCGTGVSILIALLILFAMAYCELDIHTEPSDEAVEGNAQN